MDNEVSWFWSPKRFEWLRRVLDARAMRDDEGLYFGPAGLQAYVVRCGVRDSLPFSNALASKGIAALVFFGILEPGKRGLKQPDYKRRYFPDAHGPITRADIDRFRQSRGAKPS